MSLPKMTSFVLFDHQSERVLSPLETEDGHLIIVGIAFSD